MALEIIGAGFGRTGTGSLKNALESLGFGPCHHMFELVDEPRQLPAWEAAARGRPRWNRMFRGYRSQVDWPGARYWRELSRHYPRAKVILTVRDPDAWFDSVRATIAPVMAARGLHAAPHMNALAEMAHETVDVQIFGGRMADRAHATQVFADHVAAVQAEIAPERLLTFDTSDGWPPLCDFLGVTAPDVPFPHVNDMQSFAARS